MEIPSLPWSLQECNGPGGHNANGILAHSPSQVGSSIVGGFFVVLTGG